MSEKSFLFGYSMLSSEAENAEKIINLCNANAIRFSKVLIEGERVKFCTPLFSERRLLKMARESGIELTVESRRGIPALVYRYRRRAGVLVGMVVFLFAFFFTSGLVWDIRIDGALTVSERELRKTFAECGLVVGAKIDEIDIEVLENQILILSDDISWISVNLLKNVANVEIREIDYAPPNEYGDAPYTNVTASEEGVIVGFDDVNGSICVEIGESVSKNQLLISGILEYEGIPLTLTNAHGHVFAEVDDVIEIKIPQKYIKKVTKESVKKEKSLIFFKNEIKFFSNCRNSPPFCDKIEVIENFYTVNRQRLPFAIKTANYIEYEELEVTRSQSEMLSLAYTELYRYIGRHYSNAEILARSVSVEEQADGIVLVCKLKSIKNIAQIKEIIVESEEDA